MISWIKRCAVFFWQFLEVASSGGSGAMFDYYSERISRLEALAPSELEARIARLEAAVLSNGGASPSAHLAG